MTVESGRDHTLDFLRGSAVIFMILTHTIAGFYHGENWIVRRLDWWGWVVSFTIFLFVFATIFGLKLAKGKLNVKKELSRSFVFILGYYFLALWVYFWTGTGSSIDRLPGAFKILTLRELSYFTEFILPFIFYIWLIVGLQSWLRRVLTRQWLFLVGAMIIYGVSRYLNTLNWGTGYINVIKGQLVGHLDWHTFPILPYLPVVAIGLVWGFKHVQMGVKKARIARVVSLIFFLMLILLKLSGISYFHRWPPTILFMLYGLSYSYLVIGVFEWLSRINLLRRLVDFVGKYPFEFYIFHLMLLIPTAKYWGNQVGSVLGTSIAFIAVMTVISAFILLRVRYRLTNGAL